MCTLVVMVVGGQPGAYTVELQVDGDDRAPVGEELPADLDKDRAPDLGPANGSLIETVVGFVADHPGGPEFAQIGEWLAGLVLRGRVAEEFEERVLAAAPGTVRTILDVQPAELAALPWELMRHDGLGLFTDPDRPMSRGLKLRADDKQELVPLRLLVVEGPSDEDIGSAEEVDGIITARPAWDGRLDWRVLRRPDQAKFERVFEAFRPHVLHFAGHAITDPATRNPALVVSSWRLTSDYITNVMRHEPRLVVLNACRSDGGVELVRSLTRAFMRRRAAAVIGMRGDVRGRAAACFGTEVYRELAVGGLIDRAVASARRTMYGTFDGQRDWALPALTLRVRPEQVLPIQCGTLSQADLAHIKRRLVEPNQLFVDRVEERTDVVTFVDPDNGVGSPLVLVTGPKEIGKSWLLTHLRARCALRARRVRYVDFGGEQRLGFVDVLRVIAETADDVPSLTPVGAPYHRFYHDAEEVLLRSRKPSEPDGPLPTAMPAIPAGWEPAEEGVRDLFQSFCAALERDAQ
jgi:hypothetical protein